MKNWNELLAEDMHVHSTFSDGLHTPAENLRQAEAAELKRLCCVDHVRRDTAWVSGFVAEINRLKTMTALEIFSGLETKLLNQGGDLDLPDDSSLADFLFVADHQFPLGDTTYTPAQIKTMLAQGETTPDELYAALCTATENALLRHRRIVIAHLFSILPKVGLQEADVPEALIVRLAEIARQTGAQLEVDERWKCPSFRTVTIFDQAGVPIRFSTDSHRKEKIGKYQYNRALAEQLQHGTA